MMPGRFDGAAAWAGLTAAAQAEIGAAAVELVAAWHCQRRAYEDVDVLGEAAPLLERAGGAADMLLLDLLRQSVTNSVGDTALDDAAGVPLLPSLLGAVCRKCGCSQMDACQPFSCSWVEPDLCSACVPAGGE